MREQLRATVRTVLERIEPVPPRTQVPAEAQGRPPRAHYRAQIVAADLVMMGWP